MSYLQAGVKTMTNVATADNELSITPSASDGQSEPGEQATFFRMIRYYATLSDCLRLAGALAVALAMGIFLLDGVAVVNDLQRFLTMLGLTAALTGAGLVMSLLVKEQRGSRVFISLGLLSVPVNFTVFGALVYSVMPLDGTNIVYPKFAHWQAASVADVTIAIVSGVAVLLPVVWLGYSVLARSARGWLSASLLLGSLVLVVPVRAEFWSAILALGATAMLWWQSQKFSKDALVFKTIEGKIATGLLFIAPAIVVLRSVYLYNVCSMMGLILGAGFYVVLRQHVKSRSSTGFYSGFLTFVAALVALVTSVSAVDAISKFWLTDLAVITGVALLLLAAVDLNRVSPAKSAANKISITLIALAVIALLVVSLFSSSFFILLASTALLAAVVFYGYVAGFNSVTTMGSFGIVAMTIMNAEALWLSVAQTGWWGIATAGASAIVAGSMLDRAGTVVESKS